jgi:hypothetical protein
VLSSPDSDDIGAQINLIGVPWLIIGYESSAAPNESLLSPFRISPGHEGFYVGDMSLT